MSALLCPASIDELKRNIAESNGRELFLRAGGTDWMIKYRTKIDDDAVVIDLSRISEMRGIRVENDALVIGAMTTMTEIAESSDAAEFASALKDAASCMGSVQIRNRATVGGNIANASPAADTPPAMAALGAMVCIISPDAEHTVKAEDVIGGANKSTLAPDEFIKSLIIPIEGSRVSAFKKIGSRSEVSIARINLAVSALCSDGQLSDARVFIGTLGSAARRSPEAEKVLSFSDSAARSAALSDALSAAAERMIPGRSTLPYKRLAIRALGEDVLAMLLAREGGNAR